MYTFVVPRKYLEKLSKIKEESGAALSNQMKFAIEDYLFRYERSKSPFMRSLGKYKCPEIGEKLDTEQGKAEIIDVKPYEKILDELESEGLPSEDIEDFTRRVEHFLGNKERYFECEIRYPDGLIDCLDWSEYLALKKRG